MNHVGYTERKSAAATFTFFLLKLLANFTSVALQCVELDSQQDKGQDSGKRKELHFWSKIGSKWRFVAFK
jgi:hypothetical protein